MTGEALGLATEIFMAAGALDVFTIPIQMKKNRPGILLTCLCEMEEREKFTGLFLSLIHILFPWQSHPRHIPWAMYRTGWT